MKTAFITSYHVLVSRNILQSRLIKLLTEGGWRIVVICPQKKKSFLEKINPVFIVEGVPNKLNRIDDFFKDLALAAIHTRSLRVMRKRGLGLERPLFQQLLFWAFLIKSFIPFLYRYIIEKHSFHDIFQKYQPDVVFSTDVFSAHDCRLLLEAKIHKIPALGMVRSWDNLTTKGGFRVVPDLLVTQNEIAKDEAVSIHDIRSDEIIPVGVPHYDMYTRSNAMPREAFLNEMGLPTTANYIVYAPLGDRIMKVGSALRKHSYDQEMVQMMDKFLPPNTYVVVRFPPNDTVNIDRGVLSSRIIFDVPGVRFGEGIKGIQASELRPEDDKKLLSLLVHATALVNPFSSLCVDATFLGCPTIIPHFDPREVGYWESVCRLHEFDHFREIVGHDGVFIVKNFKELEETISDLLKGKDAKVLSRLELAKRQCYAVDYKSSERLYSAIQYVLKNSQKIV